MARCRLRPRGWQRADFFWGLCVWAAWEQGSALWELCKGRAT